MNLELNAIELSAVSRQGPELFDNYHENGLPVVKFNTFPKIVIELITA